MSEIKTSFRFAIRDALNLLKNPIIKVYSRLLPVIDYHKTSTRYYSSIQNDAAGNDYVDFYPDEDTKWTIQSIRIRYVTDATAGNRTPQWVIYERTVPEALIGYVSEAVIGPSTTKYVNIGHLDPLRLANTTLYEFHGITQPFEIPYPRYLRVLLGSGIAGDTIRVNITYSEEPITSSEP